MPVFCFLLQSSSSSETLRAVFRFLTPKKQAGADVTSCTSLELQRQARCTENRQRRLRLKSTYPLRFFSARFCSDRNGSSHLGNSFRRKQKVRQELPLLCPTSSNSLAQTQAAGWIPAAELRFSINEMTFPLLSNVLQHATYNTQ